MLLDTTHFRVDQIVCRLYWAVQFARSLVLVVPWTSIQFPSGTSSKIKLFLKGDPLLIRQGMAFFCTAAPGLVIDSLSKMPETLLGSGGSWRPSGLSTYIAA